MYSIPPGGFRHPYPALSMNASMSRFVSAGMRDPPWASQSWQWDFSCFPENVRVVSMGRGKVASPWAQGITWVHVTP